MAEELRWSTAGGRGCRQTGGQRGTYIMGYWQQAQRELSPAALQVALDRHAQWVSSGGRRGALADLRGVLLVGQELGGAHLDEIKAHGADMAMADLSEASLQGANLEGVRLFMAHLERANLMLATLCEAVLREASMEGANLRGADLTGADLRGADLRSADLREAKLCGVSLRGADLTRAKLAWADLSHANFERTVLRRAELRGTNLSSADLSLAQGLTQHALDTAHGDAETRLPGKLTLPVVDAAGR